MTLSTISHSQLRIVLSPSPAVAFTLARPGGEQSLSLALPRFHLEGLETVASSFSPEAAPTTLPNGVVEHHFKASLTSHPGVELLMKLRVPRVAPVLRWSFVLRSSKPVTMTKPDGKDTLRYAAASLGGFSNVTEVRLSEFNYALHLYHLTERPVTQSAFDNTLGIMGPILTASTGRESALLAYEHGSQYPETFVQFSLTPNRDVTIDAVKGNYYAGRVIDAAHPYETIWLQAALVRGCEAALASTYREFVRSEFAPSTASRQPQLYTNTWGYQTKDMHTGKPYDFNGKMIPPILTQQIESARETGINVFVLDTGWYEKTGDYRISPDRLAAGFPALQQQMKDAGIQLGLWFEPTTAAVSSETFKTHARYKISQGGVLPPDRPVWGTENSHDMCLASGYADVFADRLIELVKETGVTYFKWDGMNQWYHCDAPDHDHGTAANSPEERRDCFFFEYVRYMNRIVEKVMTVCPDIIVDFDITEHRRCVGLAFLAVGKYFIMNDGTLASVHNPGRPTLTRYPIDYDRWLPSTLFLSHLLPPDKVQRQDINLATMILGFNGIWGDTVAMSPEERTTMARFTGLFRQVADDFTAAFPVRSGEVGDSPEIHEKIHKNGRGAVVLFGSAGKHSYATRNVVDGQWVASEGVTVTRDALGRARIDVDISAEKFGVGVVFFGAKA